MNPHAWDKGSVFARCEVSGAGESRAVGRESTCVEARHRCFPGWPFRGWAQHRTAAREGRERRWGQASCCLGMPAPASSRLCFSETRNGLGLHMHCLLALHRSLPPQGCTAVHKLKDNLRIFHELAGPVFPPRNLRSSYLVQVGCHQPWPCNGWLPTPPCVCHQGQGPCSPHRPCCRQYPARRTDSAPWLQPLTGHCLPAACGCLQEILDKIQENNRN